MYSGVFEVKRALETLSNEDLTYAYKSGVDDLAGREIGSEDWRKSSYLLGLIDAEINRRLVSSND